ncbi:hypothetical protein MmarC5_1287 [Methanococcus maripaludis C5]|uniref:Uncharacterized protein n=1 Tax=Methanococcus maripaludis (strain C5 / ATCC BAA-1333) TaxID=402880 RepID=A4FZF1_METM5|nr:hypothetical protein [Methanococcus maripaludis]ABO35585.1 hypothetical protein MmarC5_1287 [Methanococcus maripaludis C5]
MFKSIKWVSIEFSDDPIPKKSEKTKKTKKITKKEAFKKGKAFELYCLDIFPENEFDLLEMTHNPNSANGRFVESDLNPDLKFRDKKTNVIFSVECKYRSNLFKGAFKWAKYKDQADRYREYETENNIPVFIAMGLGGTPDDPEQMFIMPLKEIKYNSVYPSALEDYEITESQDVFKILR